MSMGLVFAYLLTHCWGFPAGFILLVVLLNIGETEPISYPAASHRHHNHMVIVRQILSIRLPDGIFLGG